MSVSSVLTQESFVGNNSSTPYPLTMEWNDDDDLVLEIDGSPSIEYVLGGGGFVIPNVPATSTLIMYRVTPLTQGVAFPTNTTPAAEDVSASFDKLTFIVQELAALAGVDLTPYQLILAEGAFADGDKAKLDGIAPNATIDQDLSSYQVKPAEGAFADGDKTKLDGIAPNATIDQDLSSYQVKPAEGAFADGDKTKLDSITLSAAGNLDVTGTASAQGLSAVGTTGFEGSLLLKYRSNSTYSGLIRPSNFTTFRNFTLPDKTGTFALLDDVPIGSTTSPQELTGAGAISVLAEATLFTSDAANNSITLADGSDRQKKTVVHVASSNSGTGRITATSKTGFVNVTLVGLGESVTFQYFTASGWVIIGSHAATISYGA